MPNFLFYLAAAIAIVCTLMVITRHNAVHALLYLIVSLLALALIFFLLGAPFAAVLEVIIYAGAIMVLFVFVMMMLNLGPESIQHQKRWLTPRIWIGPCILAAVLLIELLVVLAGGASIADRVEVGPQAVSQALFGPYMLGVELASILLLAGLVGAYHLARPQPPKTLQEGARW
ncbi:MAG: NADH-quinone oxidoreductase subunit J [Desulfobacteraceae bacterium]|nr:MAG: NADH-quinone oxidoreductase subunit J [Desulfobacteraceae bacterium]